MSRRTKKAELQSAQDASAPFLFGHDDLPSRPDLVTAIAAGQHKHTGARLLDNQSLVQRMVELLMAGCGLKRIAKEMGISKHSIRAAREALVARGELAPYKQRVVAMMEDCIETGLANYRDALENNAVAAAQIPIGMGILSDKRALALGEPTAISQVAAVSEDLSVDKLNAWFEGLKPAKVLAPDSSSADLPQIPAVSEGKESS